MEHAYLCSMQSSSIYAAPINTEVEKLSDGTPLMLTQVKGGTFVMGDDNAELAWVKPAHPVSIRDFYMGIYPITNQQYAAFLNDYGDSKIQEGQYAGQSMIYEHSWSLTIENNKWISIKEFDQHPVINVTWYGANEFCKWLSQETNKQYSLPSEAQWEFAARGGCESLGFPYAGSYKLKEVAWFDQNSHDETKTVGLKLHNELGLHDMNGNVWEWCLDHWHENYQGAPEDDFPWLDPATVDDPGASRVVRGGSWFFNDHSCRVSTRDLFQASNRFDSVGFRVVRY